MLILLLCIVADALLMGVVVVRGEEVEFGLHLSSFLTYILQFSLIMCLAVLIPLHTATQHCRLGIIASV